MDYLKKILSAPVYEVCTETPLELAKNLSARLGNQFWLKREDMQPVFSFKLRGAYNKIAHLSAAQLERGVICASAGNHAQGVAYSAQKFNSKAVIVMPSTTPAIKVNAVKRLGAEVVLSGNSFDEAYAFALEISKEKNLCFVHPFDDPDVIAGQGTIGMEILRQFSRRQGSLNAIFCSVGGGGLLAGVLAYIKNLQPEIKIFGVETFDSDALYQSLQAQKRVRLNQVGLFADGTAVKEIGEENFRLALKYIDGVVRVSTDAVCAAIKDVFEDTRSILEPSGALALAGAKEFARENHLQRHNLVAVTSGANMNFDRLRFVAERAEVGEYREAIFAVTLPEKPGAYKNFVRLIGNRNITEFNYRYHNAQVAHVFVGVGIEKKEDATLLLNIFKENGFAAIDLTHDEMSKNHIRYMVGGHAASEQSQFERLFRFEFPERPGALMHFLEEMSVGWNISLFHYRNHGADYGRILVGIEVPPEENERFDAFLSRLNYVYKEESQHPAYHLFLRWFSTVKRDFFWKFLKFDRGKRSGVV